MARDRGFGLLEATITVALTVTLMVGLLTLLEKSSRMAKAETNAADALSSTRSGLGYVTRILREARVGRLSYGNALLPYAENAAPGTTLIDVAGTLHTLRAGTDAVEARGVFGDGAVVFAAGDVTCAGAPCTLGSAAINVTIRQLTSTGYVNYPAGAAPAIASRTSPFYFVVACATAQSITVGASTYVAPLYVVGKVNVTGTWFTQTATGFTFTMDATDPGARTLDATSDTAALIQAPQTGGPVDDFVFYVDRGDDDPTAPGVYPHPFLAQAARDAATGRFAVDQVAPEVEDFQVAYGIDGADGSTPDGGVDPTRLSTLPNGDEWVLNAVGEALPALAGPTRIDSFYSTSVASTPPYPSTAAPALRALLVSLVTKSAAPDLHYGGPGAFGVKVLDSTAASVSAANGRSYRRVVQTLTISLRNFS
jgi:hypothetical protein